jgi:hypothetical protein
VLGSTRKARTSGAVEQFTTPQGHRLIEAFDRDFGLYIFYIAGVGAAAAPECADVAVSTVQGTPVTAPLACTDASNIFTPWCCMTSGASPGPAWGCRGGPAREAASAAGATLKAGAIARLGAQRSHGEI